MNKFLAPAVPWRYTLVINFSQFRNLPENYQEDMLRRCDTSRESLKTIRLLFDETKRREVQHFLFVLAVHFVPFSIGFNQEGDVEVPS